MSMMDDISPEDIIVTFNQVCGIGVVVIVIVLLFFS